MGAAPPQGLQGPGGMEMSEGLGPCYETTWSGRDRCEGQGTRVLWKGGCHLPHVEGRARVARFSDFFFSGEARDLTFFVFNLLIVKFVNIGN